MVLTRLIWGFQVAITISPDSLNWVLVGHLVNKIWSNVCDPFVSKLNHPADEKGNEMRFLTSVCERQSWNVVYIFSVWFWFVLLR